MFASIYIPVIMKLENKLRRYRFEKGEMTQQELADAMGVSRQTIIAIEQGKFNPSVILGIKMARFFKCPLETLFILKEDDK
jgi:putative transcriptional regulator